MSQHRVATWSLAGHNGQGETAAQNLLPNRDIGATSTTFLDGKLPAQPAGRSRPLTFIAQLHLPTSKPAMPRLLGDGGAVAAVWKKTKLSMPRKTTQTNLCFWGRLKGANVPAQSDSLEFLSVSQVRNYITNRSVTCAVARKILKPSPSHQPHVHLQQKVRPIDVQKEEERTESKSTHTSFFIKTPSTLLPARRFFWPQQWSVRSGFASLPWGERNPLNIAHHPNYRPKKIQAL